MGLILDAGFEKRLTLVHPAILNCGLYKFIKEGVADLWAAEA
jgi:hypothetical protein